MTRHQLQQLRIIDPVTKCWNFTGAINGGKRGGYGVIRHEGRVMRVHRVSYQLYGGRLKRGLVIEHTCDNRACFNPHHLRQVTQKKNLERGVKAGTVKLFKTMEK